MVTFIAFSGKKQVGKDLSTTILVDILRQRNLTVAVTAFAEPLKQMCMEILGLVPESVYGTNADKDALTYIKWDNFPLEIRLKYSTERDPVFGTDFPRTGPMSGREVLQVVGSDIFRMMIDNDVWARAPFRTIWDVDVVILTDCRFPNEKTAVEAAGGTVVRLKRDTGLEDTHISETALDETEFRTVYYNNGSIEDLKQFLTSLANRII